MDSSEGTTAATIHRVVSWIEDRGITYQINGGWAVDALLGRQSRPHRDLDVFVDADHVPGLLAQLSSDGYAIEVDWSPVRIELALGDQRIDVHPMRVTSDGDGIQEGFDGEVYHHRSASRTTGTIGGRAVVVADVERLRELREGYSPRAEDHHDLAVLETIEGARERL